MIKLTDEQKFLIVAGKETITIGNTKYYVKYGDNPIMELAGEELARRVGITCAHYETTEIQGATFLVSPDLSVNGHEFKSAYELGILSNSLYSIWDYLEKDKLANTPEIMNKVLKVYFFDTILRPADRHNANWGFLFVGDKITDVCILDNELMIAPRTTHMNTAVYEDDTLKDVVPVDPIKDMTVFLKESGPDYMELFKNIYKSLDPDIVLDVITQIEAREHINLNNIEAQYLMYINHYLKIGDLINSRGLK